MNDDLFLGYKPYPNSILYRTILKTIHYDLKDYHINCIILSTYIIFNKSKINNGFLSRQNIDYLEKYILDLIKLLFNLYKVLYKWKLFIKNKYKNNVVNTEDLCMNKIDINNKIEVYENKKTYYFSYYDIEQLFNTSLLNHNYENPKPINIKNPYTNCLFSKSNIYHIINQLNSNNNIIKLFKKSYLDLNIFLDKNYDILLKESLTEYYDDMTFKERVCYLIEYLEYYDHKINIRHFNKIELIFDYEIEIFMFIYLIKLKKKYICDDILNVFLLKKKYINLYNKIIIIDNVLKNLSNIIYNKYESSFFMKFKRIKT